MYWRLLELGKGQINMIENCFEILWSVKSKSKFDACASKIGLLYEVLSIFKYLRTRKSDLVVRMLFYETLIRPSLL